MTVISKSELNTKVRLSRWSRIYDSTAQSSTIISREEESSGKLQWKRSNFLSHVPLSPPNGPDSRVLVGKRPMCASSVPLNATTDWTFFAWWPPLYVLSPSNFSTTGWTTCGLRRFRTGLWCRWGTLGFLFLWEAGRVVEHFGGL